MPTEHEMKEFFQSVIDNVATLSSQAARVEGLEQRINELSESIQRLRDDNRNLETSLAQAHDKVNALGRDLEHTTQELSNERAVTQNLREVLISRDTKVEELNHNVEAERTAHRITLNERDDARRRGDELDAQVSSFREQVASVSSERDHWKAEASRFEGEVNDLRQKLTRVQSILAPLQAISGDMAATG